jgi:hypothetical protein
LPALRLRCLARCTCSTPCSVIPTYSSGKQTSGFYQRHAKQLPAARRMPGARFQQHITCQKLPVQCADGADITIGW